MTIASETSRVNLVGDGVNDTFTFTFEIYIKTDLLVYVDNVLQAVDVNYTVPDAGLENPDGGDIVFGAEYIPALAAVVSIILNLPYTQLIDYVEADKFPAETHERGLDRLVKIAQQLKERNARQPALLESSQYSDLTLPDPVANKLLAWKDDLSGIKNVEVESEGDLLVTDYAKTLIDDEDAVAVLATLGIDTDIVTLSLPADVTISAFVKTLLDDANATEALATLGLTVTAFAKTILDDADAAAARTTLNALGPVSIPGFVNRSKFEWKDADEINIGAAVYECNGKIVYWNSQLTSDIGSPDVSDWYYLYIDYSEIPATGLLTTSELIWSNTEPACSETKHGWYNGNDRCIFTILTDGSSNILEFFHEGNLVLFADKIADFSGGTSASFADITLTMPKFTTLAEITVQITWVTGAGIAYWRTNGQTGTTGHYVGQIRASTQDAQNTLAVITDGSQIIEYKISSTDATFNVHTDGWYFPIGM